MDNTASDLIWFDNFVLERREGGCWEFGGFWGVFLKRIIIKMRREKKGGNL